MRDGLAGIVLAVVALTACAWPRASAAEAEEKAQPLPETSAKPTAGKVLTGIDVLVRDGFAPLKGLRIGLLTHKAGRTAQGQRTVDALAAAPDVKLVRLFSPEHGLGADREGDIAAASDTATRLPIVSLYGPAKRPTPQMLEGLDAVVIDLQDVGVRFYTYATTMAYVMEEAAKVHVKVIVLDRPNPIGAAGAVGPVLDAELRSFVGYASTPLQHGMTLGELARFFNGENGIGADLAVIAMEGYARASWYDGTGLAWVSPSPNLRRLAATVLYPGVGFLEFANLSVGRGTATPFEVVGAPWIDASALAKALQKRQIRGVRIGAAEFTPKASTFAGERCQGVRITVERREAVDAVRLGLEIAVALRRLYPETFQSPALAKLLGSKEALAGIEAGKDPAAIEAAWQDGLTAFRTRAAKYQLY